MFTFNFSHKIKWLQTRTIAGISGVALLSLLFACSPAKVAKVNVPDKLAKQPVLLLKTSGKFWGFGNDGTFTLGTNYAGSFDREASKSSFFSLVDKDNTGIVATVNNKKTAKAYEIVCSGGGASLNLGLFSVGGDKSFTCSIGRDKQSIGKLVLEKDSGLVGPQGKVKGSIKVGDIAYGINSVHKSDDLLIPVDKPLGYVLKKDGNVIAVIQVQGGISIQHKPLSSVETDLAVIATIASGLRIPLE